jgi:transglutaminase/protease-like cytokinesis protein 3
MNTWKSLIETLENKIDLKEYVLSRERSSFETMNELKAFLINAPAKTDTEKAWTIFLWITHNIDYDFSGRIGNQDADNVFKTGLSVSSEYARLSKDLFDCFNIKCEVVGGYAKGYGYKIGQKLTIPDHDWNAVYIDKKWYFIEATWGSGYADPDKKPSIRNYQPYYFFTPPEIFIYNHFPENPEFQLLKTKISINEYKMLPNHNLNFFINE